MKINQDKRVILSTIYAPLPINFSPATNACLAEDDKQAAVSRNYEKCRTATIIVRVKSESILWYSCYYRKFLCIWLLCHILTKLINENPEFFLKNQGPEI